MIMDDYLESFLMSILANKVPGALWNEASGDD
jgi:hypothetical protein